jgi:PAS domain S-box-containing protein
MSARFLDDPEMYRSLLENLPVGVYVLDPERRVRFWNRGAEHLTGHLAHEAMGQDATGQLLAPCDRKGQAMRGEHCPITATLHTRQRQHGTAFYLHKHGHRVAVRVETQAICEHNDVVVGVMVIFEEAFASGADSTGPPLYGCLDASTGIPSQRLTRAVLSECMAGMEQTHQGFGLLRIRVLGLDEFRAKHGRQSALPFLRTTAHTLRHSLDPENFLARWGEDEFIAVLPSASPVVAAETAETVWSLLTQSEISWWGDRFPVKAVVSHVVARPGDQLEQLLNRLEPEHAAAAGRAVGAESGAMGSSRG